MTLTTIIGSVEQISIEYGPSLNRAFERIRTVFGRYPTVRAPLGGARTKAECDSQGTSWRTSDHYEGRPARAVDIWDHPWFRSTRARAAVFDSILAAEGWRNITTSGAPFPSEPWHYASHRTVAAGGGATQLPDGPERKVLDSMDMRRVQCIAAANPANDRPAWKPNQYVITSQGITFPPNDAGWAVVDKIAAVDGTTPIVMVGSEMEAADAWLRANAAKNAAPLTEAQLKAAIDAAFEDIDIPTPSISEADKQAIINGAGLAARKAIIAGG